MSRYLDRICRTRVPKGDDFANVPHNKKMRLRVVSILKRDIDRAFLRYIYHKKFGRPATPQEFAADHDAVPQDAISLGKPPRRSPAFICATDRMVGSNYNKIFHCSAYSQRPSDPLRYDSMTRGRMYKGYYKKEKYVGYSEKQENDDDQFNIMDIPYDKNKKSPFRMDQYKNFEAMLRNAEFGKEAWKKPNDGGPPGGAWSSNSGRRNAVVGIPNRFVKDPRDRYDYPILHRGKKQRPKYK